MIRVFKFGGASVKNAEAIYNVSEILSKHKKDKLVIIVSAIDKTTNALEELYESYFERNHLRFNEILNQIKEFHFEIVSNLFSEGNELLEEEMQKTFQWLQDRLKKPLNENKSFDYDQIVSKGEVLSTQIIHHFLQKSGFLSAWVDARDCIKTDKKFQEANVNWEETSQNISKLKEVFVKYNVIISQGFIGSTKDNFTTTLGREGSDFSAAIFAYCLDAKDVTIWKDVPGMLNADPKYFDNTVLLDKISFREAIELSYYGASVIHPKTVKPLQNKNISWYVRSFVNDVLPGTTIQQSSINDSRIPSYIFKFNQVLFTISPMDFSFLVEENLGDILLRLSKLSIHINLMQNSALSFSILVDRNKINPEILMSEFSDKYLVKYNEGLELITIRHYDDHTIEEVTNDKRIIVQQRTRSTARFVVKSL